MTTIIEKAPMDEHTGITGWVIGGIGTIGTILTSVIAMFYKTQIADYKAMIAELKAKVDMLEKEVADGWNKYNEIRVAHAVLMQRVSDLEASKVGHETLNRKLKGNP